MIWEPDDPCGNFPTRGCIGCLDVCARFPYKSATRISQVTGQLVPRSTKTDRYDIAWLIWCWRQDYVTAEDRERVANWLLGPESRMSAADIAMRDSCLLLADEIIEVVRQLLGVPMEKDPAPCSHCGGTDHDSDHCPGQGG